MPIHYHISLRGVIDGTKGMINGEVRLKLMQADHRIFSVRYKKPYA